MLRSMAKTSVSRWPESLSRARLRLASPPKNSRAVRAEAIARTIHSRRSVVLERSIELAPSGVGRLLCVGSDPSLQ